MKKDQKKSGREFNFLEYLPMIILKPLENFKKEEKNLSDQKNTLILGLIVVAILTVLKLISTILNTIRVTSLFGGTKWVFENIKNINFIKTIGGSFITYAIIIVAMAGIYYLASLVIKKETNFFKLIGASITAFIPVAISSTILSTVLSIISIKLGVAIVIIGFIYSLLILLELINDLIPIENQNTKIYFHLTCLSILFLIGAFVGYKIIVGSVTSGIGSL